MSKPLSKSQILFSQRACGLCGCYAGAIDGNWSEQLAAAEEDYSKQSQSLVAKHGSFDARSEKNIVSLIIPAQELARKFLKMARSHFPLRVAIISGTRSYAEQDALYAIGRTVDKTHKRVTNARGGESNHNFGLAWDVGIFEAGGRYMTGDEPKDNEAYAALAKLAKPALPDLEWGGDWKSFPDAPHYQLDVGVHETSQMRAIFEAGKPLSG